jgi:hypothetical protein
MTFVTPLRSHHRLRPVTVVDDVNLRATHRGHN